MAQERVQKILAKAGIASRRKAEELIQEGQVTINGKVAQLGDKAEFGKDAIKVKGKLLLQTEAPIYIAFYKPKNIISMMADPEGRPTLSDYFTKVKARLFPIGRLDFTSEGLILLTNDGDFAEKLQRRDDIPRVYNVKIKGHPPSDTLARLESGARIGNRTVKPHSVRMAEELTSKTRVEIVFLESGAIDVKTYFEHKGFLVERLTRTAIGHITLRGLNSGEYRILKPSQAQALLEQPELGLRAMAGDIEKYQERVRSEKKKAIERGEEKRPVRRRLVIRPGQTEERASARASDSDTESRGKVQIRPRGPKAPSSFDEPRERKFGPRKSFGEKKPFGERKSYSGGRDAGGSSWGGDRPRGGAGKKPGGRFGSRSSGRFGDESREGGSGGKRSAFGGARPPKAGSSGGFFGPRSSAPGSNTRGPSAARGERAGERSGPPKGKKIKPFFSPRRGR